jgi:hypothetical protein
MLKTSEAEPAALAQLSAEHMRAIDAGLAAGGLTTHLTDSRVGLDLTATFRSPGQREVEVWIDEDGYAELRYWNPAGTSPAQVTATALRALQAIIGTLPDPGPPAEPAA